jgi:phosphoribosyl-AMP cyclohydrolase
MNPAGGWLDEVRFDERGLVTAIAQDSLTQRILMVAWMDREALQETARTGRAGLLVPVPSPALAQGEESGNSQIVREIRTDCDGDVVLLIVEQVGGVACHTGGIPASSECWKRTAGSSRTRSGRPRRALSEP